MSTYVIGDIQGCYQPLMQLLDIIRFDQHKDTLWFTGDLVNRGPQSLEVLRFVRNLGERHQTVLGNHDLHLLAVSCGQRKMHEGDTLQEILDADDCQQLLDWLRHRPLLVQHAEMFYVMTHAGLAPSWSIGKAKNLAQEVEKVLQGNQWQTFFAHMYGNQPDTWNDDLTGFDRLRCIINYFTRMRFCYRNGRLELSNKGTLKDKGADLVPWFDVKPRENAGEKIIFGHWAALGGEADVQNVFALDTGCVWGNKLSAMRLEDEKRFSVPCTSKC
jgi:bis(5'-nucleosyl)-tetraphosphatase (symmetrical)